MLFQTPEYAVFLAVILLLYFRLSHRGQNILLLAGGLFFYGSWDYRFLGLMLASAGVDYASGLRVAEARARGDRQSMRRWLVASMTTNLVILGFFKYFNFFVDSAASLLTWLGFAAHPHVLAIVLPIGISFYTFQSMSYTIEIYRGELEPTHDPIEYFLFVSFFPHLVAGPIMRSTSLLPQVQRPRVVTRKHIEDGALLFAIGFIRKIAIADPAGMLADNYFAHPANYSTIPLVAGLLLYGLQIYNDFAGYSEMARGSASLLGFTLTRNFRHPYFAADVSDFWRRWHISLSTWLRDYLYIPLGGNRLGRRRTYANLMTTMLLGGLWHGASWNFVIWGGLHGAYLAIHHALQQRGRSLTRLLLPGMPRLVHEIAGRAGVFALVTFTWLFFRAHDFQTTTAYLHGLLALRSGFDGALIPVVVLALLTVCIDLPQALADNEYVLLRLPVGPRVALAAAATLLLMVNGNLGQVPFIYFQF